MVLGEDTLISIITYCVNILKDGVGRIYDLITAIINIIQAFVNFIILNFSYDNSKKTLMLSLIWVIIIFGLIFIFGGSWSQGGINTTDKKMDYSIDLTAYGGTTHNNEDNNLGGDNTQGGNITPPKKDIGDNLNITCYTDSDCEKKEVGVVVSSPHCCNADTYKGYSCAGKCLKSESYSLDYCTHPNSCVYPGSFDSFVGNDPARCDNRVSTGIPAGDFYGNTWCQKRETNQINPTSVCCHDTGEVSPCYGYCLKPDSSINCYDINACYSQNSPMVNTISGGDV